jgi:two-component sensor histidine kinase
MVISYPNLSLQCVINILVALGCGALLFANNPRSKKNRFVALHCMLLAFCYFFFLLWSLTPEPDKAYNYFRLSLLVTVFLPTTHFHHVLTVFELETPRRTQILRIFYVGSVVFAASLWTPLFFSGLAQRLEYRNWPVPGPLLYVFCVQFLSMVAYSLWLEWSIRRHASPVVRNKMAWIIVATVLGYLGAGSNWPFYFGILIPPVFNISVSFYLLICCFLFFQLGLLDVTLFFRDVLLHLLTASLLGAAAVWALTPIVDDSAVLLGIFAASWAAGLLYRPTFTFVKKLAAKTRWAASDDYTKSLDVTVAQIKETTYTYDDLANNIVRSVLNTLPVEMAAVYFHDLTKGVYHLKAQQGMISAEAGDLRYNRSELALQQNDPLIRYFGHQRDLVLRDAIESKPDVSPRERGAVLSMKRIEAEICAPFIFAGKVKGLLVIGRKLKNQMFNKEDTNALYSFARMGEEVMRYIMGMEAELNNTALYSHDMNNDTKSLVQTLQYLQSPLAAKQNRERVVSLLRQAEDVAVRLNQSFQLNRDRSSLIMRSIRGDYDKSPVDITGIVRLSYSKFVLQAEKKGVALTLECEPGPILVLANELDLIRVFDNLVGNALRYVSDGGIIHIKATSSPDAFLITIKDDGVGIDQQDIERIWAQGWQAKDARQGASGFGLSIARQIVHLHHGTITATSEGRGKGTVFTISIPLAITEKAEEIQEKAE